MQNETVNIGIGDSERAEVGALLNKHLANAYVLAVKAKNFHWNMRGMEFAYLHPFLDKIYEMSIENSDAFAERARSLGVLALGSMAEFLKATTLKEEGRKDLSMKAMMEMMLADLESIIRSLREDVAVSDKAGDAGTADFLTGMMEAAEKMAWMVRSHV